jgi:transcriptional regulator with XRE-family HTH domain
MTEQSGPNYRRRQLGRTLRRLREGIGMSQEEMGRPLRFSKSKMSRVEQGFIPGYNDFLALLDRCGVIVSDYEPYVRMFDYAKERGWWHAVGLDDRGFVPVEAEASAVRTYQLGFVPGLLQTEAYLRGTFDAARQSYEGERLENEVAIRLRRKDRLFEESPLSVSAIIDETVLRRESCDREQRQHIVELATLPNVAVQVIPHAVDLHPGLYSNFIVVSFPDPVEPELAYVEYGFGSMQIEKEQEVRAARLLFEHLAEVALDEQGSLALISGM